MVADTIAAHQTLSLQMAPSTPAINDMFLRGRQLIHRAYPNIHASHPHMSLAYPLGKNKLSAAEEQAVAIVMKTLPRELTFGAPRCCAFEDMNRFVPIFPAPMDLS